MRLVCDLFCQSVSRSLCEQDYCNQPVSLTPGVMIYANRKNWLTLGGDPVPDTNSLFHFPHHCGIRDFTKLISIFPIFTTLDEMTDANKIINSQYLGAIRQTSG